MLVQRLDGLALVVVGMTLASCANAPPVTSATSAHDSSAELAAAAERVVMLDGDANGLIWDDASTRLLIAVGDTRLESWREADGLRTIATFPPSGAPRAGFGQPVVMSGGTVVIPRFGGGELGDVVYVLPDGTTHTVPNLDPKKRRIGLTVDRHGDLYESYFMQMNADGTGAIARVALAGGERDVVTGLKKPVGVVALSDALVIADQGAGTLLSTPWPVTTTPALTVIAHAPSLDLLAAGPDGSFFTGGRDGTVRRIGKDGHVTVVVSGLHQVRGVAYEPAHHRLYFVDHAPPSASTLHVRTVD